ncbi:MAG: helix-turn-helix domain-containing protein [Pseudoclavibacter sp.]
MNAERISLERRAEVHAALADVARLRIVDLLVLGDRSPSELQLALGLPSNLVAHHLGVLESAGLVTRTRSEGDGRRSYVRLERGVADAVEWPPFAPDARIALDAPVASAARSTEAARPSQSAHPAPIALPAPLRATRVVFVCTGNSARSPMAAALWRLASEVPATSGGTKPAASTSPRAIRAAARRGVDLGSHLPRDVASIIAPGDLVVAVCDRAHEALRVLNELHWSVPNPGTVGTGAAYDAAFADIAARVSELAPRVAAA